ncbi:DnaJ domain-containing protein [Paraburkholderia phymatum]|uniref:Heat shock protein DnaJ domain protein n=1 Tax=Paraburkholderia phymatum (strain DSM 17167 / CIP 108236 / LMG 21445 / STM815) TaxID=391038 RepID=B2JHQ1_PARP8|nr:DnaJ domain-containing protein [Paraburkholderia phymatum]ACC70393.1 heat shock protein DnaJ domain protein [Paraburkholderia phymatum STM815]
MATLYAKLGVSQDATWEEIKRAYRKAAMKWHPDRNVGQEEAARAAFQEIKDAYAILSDEGQRKVYDAVYAQEMRRWEALQKRQQEVAAARARKAEADAHARYSQLVGVAMRYADEGHNRDVLFGVLLGRDCDADMAQRIADSVWALQQARQAAQTSEPADAMDAGVEVASSSEASDHETPSPTQPAAAKRDKPSHDARAAGLFDSLWQGFFGVRS